MSYFYNSKSYSLFFSRFLPPGIHMKFKFVRNSDELVILNGDASKKYKIKILDLYVEFRKILVDEPILRRELQLFDSGKPYLVQFTQGKLMVNTIPKARMSYYQPDLITGVLPKQIIIGFVNHKAYNGSYGTNPYVFENLKIRSLVFNVNGVNSPPDEYEPDYTATPVKCVRGNVQ